MQRPHLNIIWWQLIVFVNILQIFLVRRYDEHLITRSILLFLFRCFQSSLVGRFCPCSIVDGVGIYTYGFSNLGVICYAGRQKKKKVQNPKIQKRFKTQNPKITHTCVCAKDKAYALNPNPKL